MKRVLLTLFTIVFVATAFANKITVTNTDDDGVGSFRAALDSAANGDSIDFNVTGIIKLKASLDISKSIVIIGPGADLLAIDGDNKHKIFEDGWRLVDTIINTVEISGLELKNAYAPYNGGAIEAYKTHLKVYDCNIHSNFLDYTSGAGILSYGIGSSVEIKNSAIHDNTSLGLGSGLFVTDTSTVNISNSTFYNNNTGTVGGGIGGLSIFIYGSDLTLTNVTVAGDTGVSAIMLRNYKDSRDTNEFKDASLTIENCIFENEGGNLGFFDSLSMVTVISLGHNISNDSSMMNYLTAVGDKNNVSALLDTNGIQFNGGATPTVALGCGSPALDSGKLIFPTDQNHRPRFGSGPDIGAHEGNAYPSDSTFSLEACDRYFWAQSDLTYTQSGTYIDTIANTVGCDSVVTLHLTINHSFYDTLMVEACDSFYWRGRMFDSTGFYTDSFATTKACDSLFSLSLTIYTTNDSISRVLDTLISMDINSTYQWIDCRNGDSVFVADTNRWFAPLLSGQYAVVLTNGACVDTTACYNMVKIGLNENHLHDNDFKIFPNPTNHYLNIKVKQEIIGSDLLVYDLAGNIILRKSINKVKDKIDISSFAIGIYMLRYEGRAQKLVIGR